MRPALLNPLAHFLPATSDFRPPDLAWTHGHLGEVDLTGTDGRHARFWAGPGEQVLHLAECLTQELRDWLEGEDGQAHPHQVAVACWGHDNMAMVAFVPLTDAYMLNDLENHLPCLRQPQGVLEIVGSEQNSPQDLAQGVADLGEAQAMEPQAMEPQALVAYFELLLGVTAPAKKDLLKATLDDLVPEWTTVVNTQERARGGPS
jgi:hypothetical protein